MSVSAPTVVVTRAEIVACARTYLGTKFVHQGRIKGRAIDCLGLPLCVAEELGIEDRTGRPIRGSDYLNYSREPMDGEVLTVFCEPRLYQVIGPIQTGDLLCMNVRKLPCHVAIVSQIEPSVQIIHAYPGLKKVAEHGVDDKWIQRIAGVFSFLDSRCEMEVSFENR